MQANTNTDMVGGLAVLAVSAFFYSQISEDFTQFGVFFPSSSSPAWCSWESFCLSGD